MHWISVLVTPGYSVQYRYCFIHTVSLSRPSPFFPPPSPQICLPSPPLSLPVYSLQYRYCFIHIVFLLLLLPLPLPLLLIFPPLPSSTFLPPSSSLLLPLSSISPLFSLSGYSVQYRYCFIHIVFLYELQL